MSTFQVQGANTQSTHTALNWGASVSREFVSLHSVGQCEMVMCKRTWVIPLASMCAPRAVGFVVAVWKLGQKSRETKSRLEDVQYAVESDGGHY